MPGVGNTAGSVMDTVYGSGLLIKSAVGVGGVIAIVILCLYPMMKVFYLPFIPCGRSGCAAGQRPQNCDGIAVGSHKRKTDVRVFTGIRTYVFTVDSHCVSQYKSWLMTDERRFHGSSISDGETGCSILLLAALLTNLFMGTEYKSILLM